MTCRGNNRYRTFVESAQPRRHAVARFSEVMDFPERRTSVPFGYFVCSRGTPGGAWLCPQILVWRCHTSDSASLPGIPQWHLLMPTN